MRSGQPDAKRTAGSPKVKTLCPHCNRSNRVAAAEEPDALHCEHCRKRLIPPKPLVLTDELLKRSLKQDEIPLVIDFWSPGCSPCKQMARVFDAAAQDAQMLVRFAKLNVADYPQLASKYKIRNVPTVLVLKRGRETARSTGTMNQSQFYGWVNKQLS